MAGGDAGGEAVLRRLVGLLSADSAPLRQMGLVAVRAATSGAAARGAALWGHVVGLLASPDPEARSGGLSAMQCLLGQDDVEGAAAAAAGVSAAYAETLRSATDPAAAERLRVAGAHLAAAARALHPGAAQRAAADGGAVGALRAATADTQLRAALRGAAAAVLAPFAAAAADGGAGELHGALGRLRSRATAGRAAGDLLLVQCLCRAGAAEPRGRSAAAVLDTALGVVHHAIAGDADGSPATSRPTTPGDGSRPSSGSVRRLYPGRPETPSTPSQRVHIPAGAPPTSLAALYPGAAVVCAADAARLPARRGTPVDFLRSGRGHREAAARAAGRCGQGAAEVIAAALGAAGAALDAAQGPAAASVTPFAPAAAGQALAVMQWEPLQSAARAECSDESGSEQDDDEGADEEESEDDSDEEDEEEEGSEEEGHAGAAAAAAAGAMPGATETAADSAAEAAAAEARLAAARLLCRVCEGVAEGAVGELHRARSDWSEAPGAPPAEGLAGLLRRAALDSAAEGSCARYLPLLRGGGVIAAPQIQGLPRPAQRALPCLSSLWHQAISSGALAASLSDPLPGVREAAAQALRVLLVAAAVCLRAEAAAEAAFSAPPCSSVAAAVGGMRPGRLFRALRRCLQRGGDEAALGARCCVLLSEVCDATPAAAVSSRGTAAQLCRAAAAAGVQLGASDPRPLLLAAGRMCSARILQGHRLRPASAEGLAELCGALADCAAAGGGAAPLAAGALGVCARSSRGALSERDPALGAAVTALAECADRGDAALAEVAAAALIELVAAPAPLVDYDRQREVHGLLSGSWAQRDGLLLAAAGRLAAAPLPALPPPQASQVFAAFTQRLAQSDAASPAAGGNAPSGDDLLPGLIVPPLGAEQQRLAGGPTAARLRARRLALVRGMRALLAAHPGGIDGAALKHAVRASVPLMHAPLGELCAAALLLCPEALAAARGHSRNRLSQYVMCLAAPRAVELLRCAHPGDPSGVAAASTAFFGVLAGRASEGACYSVSSVAAAALAAVGVPLPRAPRLAACLERQQQRPSSAGSVGSVVSSYGGEVPLLSGDIAEERVWQEALAEQLRLGAAAPCPAERADLAGAAVAAALAAAPPGAERDFVAERLADWLQGRGLEEMSAAAASRAQLAGAAALRRLAEGGALPESITAEAAVWVLRSALSGAEPAGARLLGRCSAALPGSAAELAAAAAAAAAEDAPAGVVLEAAAAAVSSSKGSELSPDAAADLCAACSALLQRLWAEGAPPGPESAAAVRCCAAAALRRPGACFERVLRPLGRAAAADSAVETLCAVLGCILSDDPPAPTAGPLPRAGAVAAAAAQAELAHHCGEALRAALQPGRGRRAALAALELAARLPEARLAAPAAAAAAAAAPAVAALAQAPGAAQSAAAPRGPKGAEYDEAIERELRDIFGDGAGEQSAAEDDAVRGAALAAAQSLLERAAPCCSGAALAGVAGCAAELREAAQRLRQRTAV